MTRAVQACLVAVFLLFVPGLLEQFEAPKAAVVRVLGLFAATAWVATEARRRSFSPRPLDVAIFVWLGVEVVTTVGSVSPRLSLLGDTLQREGLLTSLGLFGIYLASRAEDPRAIRSTLQVALAAAGIAAFYAILQVAGLDPMRWSGVPVYAGDLPFPRPSATLGHPNILGVLSAAAFAASLSLVLSEPRWALAGGALTTVFASATVLTMSRGAWLGAAAGGVTAVMLATTSRGGAKSAAKVLAWAAGVCVVGAVVIWASGLGPTLATRFAELFHPATGSARSRLEIWRIALLAWQARPWLGHGPDTFGLLFQRFQTQAYWTYEWGTVQAHAHSIYLQALATRGVAGVAAGLGVTATLVVAGKSSWKRAPQWRPVTAALIGIIVAEGVAGLFGVLGMSGAVLLVFALGSLVSLGAKDRTGEAPVAPAGPSERPARKGVPAGRARAAGRGAGGFAWTAAWVVGMGALAWSAADLLALGAAFQSMDCVARRPRDLDGAVRSADLGVRLMPWDDVVAYYRAQALALVTEIAPDPRLLDEAELSARRAITLAPMRPANHQILGTILMGRVQDGDSTALPAAEAAFGAAQRLAPYNTLMMLQLARAEVGLGRREVALSLVSRAHQLYPKDEGIRGILDALSGNAAADSAAAHAR